MTKQELNRDIKRLVKNSENITDKNRDAIEKEFLRLYRADKTFEYMNLYSVKMMLRLNVRHRYIPLHQFGQQINLPYEK